MVERVGISGWRYRPWKGDFYPKGLKPERELEFVSKNLNTLEINGTFYSLQSPERFKSWRDQTAADFVFSVKGSRYITHIKRLKDIEIPLANFFASGVLELKEKLGPILWQLPPSLRFDRELFDSFLNLLPMSAVEAAKLAKGHDERTKGRTSLQAHGDFKLRHAIEARNETFDSEQFFGMLKERNVALVISDAGNKWPYFEKICADFIYIRLHGNKELYASGYSHQALTHWRRKIEQWQGQGLDVFVYFDNDVKVHAPFNAMYLLEKLSGHNPPDFHQKNLLNH